MKSIIYSLLVVLALNADAQQVKWHPGHYILINERGANSQESYLKGNFLGIQRKYGWKDLEPKRDKYDFSIITNDLRFLEKHGKRLVIQIQTKAFGQDESNVPEYFKSQPGWLYRTSTGSLNPTYWNREVSERIEKLYQALGKAFDKEPFLEAMVIAETAISSSISRGEDQAGVEKYTTEKYAGALEKQMLVLKQAFPTTVVIQYTNFPKDALGHMTKFEMEHGIGMGGPDINLYSRGLNDPKDGIYLYYDVLKDKVPLGSAVQSEDYDYKKLKPGDAPPGARVPPSMEEIYLFAKNRLHLNYMFWLQRPKYFEQVLEFMNSDKFPKDPAGGLNTARPAKM